MLSLLPPMLAQVAPGVPGAPGADTWNLNLDSIFWITLLFIFLTAIISAFIRMRQKDKCLKLLHDYHVSYGAVSGRTIWGDLSVFSQGVELRFDVPYRTGRGLIKSSAMIYQPELAQQLAVLRWEPSLTPEEKQARLKQVRRSFRPGLFRRFSRWLHNIFNTIRDAFVKAFSAFIGQLAKVNPASSVLTTQRSGVEQIGSTLIAAPAGNAYEPMLEEHIGQPVVLELQSPADPAKKIMELPGYLVDYTQQYVAVFNVDHHAMASLDLKVSQTTTQPNVTVTLEPGRTTVTCTGPEAVVINCYEHAGRQVDLGVVLTNGSSIDLPRGDDQPISVQLVLTRTLDIVCPRAQASVRYGGDTPRHTRDNWRGMAPEHEAEQEHPLGLRERLLGILVPRSPAPAPGSSVPGSGPGSGPGGSTSPDSPGSSGVPRVSQPAED